mgnify:CR=1 FL=1
MALRELDRMLTVNGGNEAKKQIEDVDKSVDKLKDNMQDADKQIGKGGGMAAMFKKAGDGMQKLGANIMKEGAKWSLATAPLAIGLKKGFSDALDIDNHIRQVQTLADAAVLPVDKIKESVKQISSEAAMSQQDVASAMYEALSSGVDTKDVVGFTSQGIKLAKAGFTDLETVIDSTTTVLNAYGDQAMAVSDIQDIFVKTQDLGKITVDELGKSIGRVIPTAAASGVNVDQLGASYALLTSRGMNANLATTALNSMLVELSSSGTKADKILKQKTGKNFTQLTAEGKDLSDALSILNTEATASGESLGDMFGNANAAKAAQSLFRGGEDDFKNFLKEMQNASGAVDKNFDTMMKDSPAFKWEKAKTDMTNALADMGGAVSPVVSDMAGKLGGLAEKFSNLSPEVQGAAGKMILFLVSIGPILGILGGVIRFGGMILSGLGTMIGVLGGPFTLALIAGGTALFLFRDKLYLIPEAASNAWGKVREFGEGVSLGFKSSMEEGKTALGNLKNATTEMVNTLASSETTFGEKINSIKSFWESLKTAALTPINFVVNMIKTGFNAIAGKPGGNGAARVGGSRGSTGVAAFALGSDYIPYDNFPAFLHKGEMVLTAEASSQYRAMGGTKDGLKNNDYISQGQANYIDRSTAHNDYNYQKDQKTDTFSPTINVNISGNADDNTANNIADTVRSELEAVFRQLRLQQV